MKRTCFVHIRSIVESFVRNSSVHERGRMFPELGAGTTVSRQVTAPAVDQAHGPNEWFPGEFALRSVVVAPICREDCFLHTNNLNAGPKFTTIPHHPETGRAPASVIRKVIFLLRPLFPNSNWIFIPWLSFCDHLRKDFAPDNEFAMGPITEEMDSYPSSALNAPQYGRLTGWAQRVQDAERAWNPQRAEG
ncbi:hypothetical protein BD779DRAFT_1474653 [Infundibulicybe gibba]|nr:hypothetical protein BD779DRAFT_1474653 [Infundibulicybe gibba]